jgi:hypothetical protein
MSPRTHFLHPWPHIPFSAVSHLPRPPATQRGLMMWFFRKLQLPQVFRCFFMRCNFERELLLNAPPLFISEVGIGYRGDSEKLVEGLLCMTRDARAIPEQGGGCEIIACA